MTQQTDHRDTILPSLRDKLRTFADDLTPEEWAQLRALPPENGIGEPLPSLRAKLQRSVDGLTAEERAVLHQLLQEWGATEGRESDTAGHMVDLYGIYEPGKKGRLHVGEQPTSSNGGAVLAAVLNGTTRAAAYLQQNQSSWVPGL